ncbi:MAG: carboxypeptidase regulatory-like domain-containing protein [Planctomycetes bacterium]|nr:carboxypeptidase regulatory-like domain-containing protein [Planctomycetota bacterium]
MNGQTRPRALTARGSLMLCAAAILTLGLAGCGEKPTATVTGTVLFGGQPMTGWNVNFEMASRGQATMTSTDPAGRFSFPGTLEPGEYAVFVTPPTPDPTPGAAPKRTAITPAASAVPAKFQEVGTSGLKVTVNPGANDLRIDIKP